MADRGWLRRLTGIGALVALAGLGIASPAGAAPDVPQNLGTGLAELVREEQRRSATGRPGDLRVRAGGLAVRDRAGRVLVVVRLAAAADPRAVAVRLRILGLRATARARGPRSHLVEGFVAVEDVEALAGAPGVGAVHLVPRPVRRVGATTSQGVVQHRVDRLPPGVDGSGITVAALSDSFDVATATPAGDPLTVRAADDVASGDLPGPGNPRNPEPVRVLEDAPEGDPFAIDEGRAMLQLVHDLAPGATLCFATAVTGSVGFAENIRRLADPAGGCGADVVVDDIGYLDEPFFEDGVIARAVDDVAAQGTHYFSSAGNDGDQRATDARFSPVAPDDPAVAAAGLELAAVDPELYAGGLHDADPGPGVDVAQGASLEGGAGLLILQWDDPFDPEGPEPLLETTGEVTRERPEPSATFAGEAGRRVVVELDAVPSGTVDLLFALIAPDGTVLTTVDTGGTPERLALRLPQTGTYTVVVAGYQGATGPFVLRVAPVVAGTSVTTDFNVLLFDADGDFIGSAADLNTVSGRPIETLFVEGRDQGVQIVIARAGPDAGTAPEATRLRSLLAFGLLVEEHVQPLPRAVFGHPAARGATAVAAYGPFAPFLPEGYTSPGGLLEFPFGPGGERLDEPELRRKPDLAALAGANTTFFVQDSPLDPDAFPNFFGTSASAPHAAAIAALALQAAGGGGARRPDDLRRLLQRSTFPHDLDPYRSSARRGALTLEAVGARGDEGEGATAAARDPRFFRVRYDGRASVVRLELDASGGNPTGPPRAPGRRRGGLVFDPRPPVPEDPAAGGFPFTLGPSSPGIGPEDVRATFLDPARPPAAPGQFERLVLDIAPGTLTGGRTLAFGVDRDEHPNAAGTGATDGDSADQLADGVLLPEGRIVRGGVRFTARLSSGVELRGRFRNRIGSGWTPLDGFGFVDAQRAVRGVR